MTRTQSHASPQLEPGSTASRPPRGPGRTRFRGLTSVILLLSAVGALAYLGWTHPKRIREAWSSLTKALSAPAETRPGPSPPAARRPWDGLVTLGERGRTAMGIE